MTVSVTSLSRAASRKIEELVRKTFLRYTDSGISHVLSWTYPKELRMSITKPQAALQAEALLKELDDSVVPQINNAIQEHPVDSSSSSSEELIVTDSCLGFLASSVLSMIDQQAYDTTLVFQSKKCSLSLTRDDFQSRWASIASNLLAAIHGNQLSLATRFFQRLQDAFREHPFFWVSVFPHLSCLLADYLLLLFPASLTYIKVKHIAIPTLTRYGTQLQDQRVLFATRILNAFTPTHLSSQTDATSSPRF